MDASRLAKISTNLAYGLFALFMTLVVIDSLPLKILNPGWILTEATIVVNYVTIPLVGVGLIHLAAHLCPTSQFLAIQNKISRMALWASLGFFLLLPLIAFLTVRNSFNIERLNKIQRAEINKKADQLNVAISKANTIEELQGAMQALQGPQINPNVKLPLPEVKSQLLDVVKQARIRFSANILGPYAEQNIPALKQVLRTFLLSLVSAITFASVAWIPQKDSDFMTSLLEYRKQLFSSNRLTVALASMVDKYKLNKNLNSTKRASEERARKLDRMKKDQEKKLKRNLELHRKQQIRLERSRKAASNNNQSNNEKK